MLWTALSKYAARNIVGVAVSTPGKVFVGSVPVALSLSADRVREAMCVRLAVAKILSVGSGDRERVVSKVLVAVGVNVGVCVGVGVRVALIDHDGVAV